MKPDLLQQIEAMKLGEQVLGFLNGPIGQHLTKRAEAEERAALEKLANHDPHDAKGIQALQNEVYRVQMVMAWLAEAVHEALSAKEALAEIETLPPSSVPESGGEG